jgi:hypothetical protein
MDLSNNLDNSDTNRSKWSHLKKYFKEMSHSEGNSNNNSNITFQCLLCIPKIKTISTSTTSNSNLRSHIKVSRHIIIY